MFYVRKKDGRLEFLPISPDKGAFWYTREGYMRYAGTLDRSRIDIVGGDMDERGIVRGGTITELPAPEPTQEWVEKRPFVSAITTLLPDEAKAALAANWQTQAWIAKLPGDMVNMLDPEVSAFLTAAGLTLEQVRTQMEG